MSEEGSMSDNMEKGRGRTGKFKVVGTPSDKDHPEVTGKDPMAKGPGRPSDDKVWTIIGRTAEEENADQK